MKITYMSKNFRTKSLDLIDQANRVIEQYEQAGYDLTLRQLYYQMVSRDIIPNTQKSYKSFGSLVSDARLAGLIDWESIVDRTRTTMSRPHWTHPSQVITSAWHSYNINHWEGQEFRPRVWIEKDALTGVIQSTCNKFDVPFLACRGYMSQSAMWKDSQVAMKQEAEGLKPVIIHLGDHDPSGIDMTRDIDDRMIIFGVEYEVHRIALNWDQVEEKKPPPNPTKLSDSRAAGYIDQFGYSSWELDALEPNYINELISDKLWGFIDEELWNSTQNKLTRHKDTLEAISDNYEIIEEHLEGMGLL